MSTGTDIIKAALQKIGAHSVASPANPEAIETGREALNSMLEMWLTRNIRIGFTPLRVPGDELNEPRDCYNGIVNMLAVELAGDFDNGKAVLSANVVSRANSEFAEIKRNYQALTIPKKKVSSTLPRGQGNTGRFFGDTDRVFFGEVDELDS